MELKIGDRVMLNGGYGASSYSLPGTICEASDYEHITGGRCDHDPRCVWWFVKLDTGSTHGAYENQLERI